MGSEPTASDPEPTMKIFGCPNHSTTTAHS